MKQQLSFFEILMICIGTIIGTGIFLIPGLSAKIAGTNSLIIWFAIAITSIPMGLTFANLSGFFKRSGGPIIFAKTAFGDFFGFIAGWTSWAIAAITISGLALAIPFFLSFSFNLSFMQKTLISFAVLTALTAINYFGIKFGSRMQTLLTLITLIVLLSFIIFASQKINIENFSFTNINLSASLVTAVLIFEAFAGWEACTIIAGEVKNSRKTIPKAIIITAIVIAILYFLIALISIGVAGASALALSSAPLVQVVSFSGTATMLMLVSIIIINIACLNSWIMTTSHLPYALAKENLFIDFFEHKNKYGIPDRALFLQFVFSSLLVSGGNYVNILFLAVSLIIILYMLCFLSALKLRKIRESSFKINPIIIIFSIIILLILFTQIDVWIIITGISITIIGVPAYVLLKLWNDRNFIEKFYDKISLIFDFMFPICYGDKERKKVLKNAEIKKNHTILDYGCGTGITTMELAKKAKKIIAADISKKQIEKAFEKSKHDNIIFVKISKFAPFEHETFDRIIAVGVLDHFAYPEKELKQLNKVLKKGGIISCLCFGTSLGIPSQKFLRRDNIIKNIFKRAGFSEISVERRKKWLTEYIFIKARKI